jgi:hypothetical protein
MVMSPQVSWLFFNLSLGTPVRVDVAKERMASSLYPGPIERRLWSHFNIVSVSQDHTQ